jgi:hypothetical protein
MAARTAIVPIAVLNNNGVSGGVGTAADAANGMTIPAPGPFKVLLRVDNTDTVSHTFTVRAGGSGLSASGGTAVPTPFTQATVGDSTVTVAATTGSQVFWVLDTDRFTQADGSLSVDFAAATGMKIWAYQLPAGTI